MKKFFRMQVVGVLLGCWMIAGAQQEGGEWRAASKTAQSITGDVAISGQRISLNFNAFTIVRMRDIKPAEVQAVFDLDSAPASGGSLYRTEIPGDKKFLHKNTLCGDEDVTWMATYASGKTLHVAFFSGPKEPVLTAVALIGSSNLCNTFTYER